MKKVRQALKAVLQSAVRRSAKLIKHLNNFLMTQNGLCYGLYKCKTAIQKILCIAVFFSIKQAEFVFLQERIQWQARFL